MSRKDDLELAISESHALIREYEGIIRVSSDPKERYRAQNIIREQKELVESNFYEYRRLFGEAEEAKLHQIQEGTTAFPGLPSDWTPDKTHSTMKHGSQVFWRSGGPLPPDHSAYVERGADRQALWAIERGDFVHLFAPRQMGKTSLLFRLGKTLTSRGWRVVYCDLAQIQGDDDKEWFENLGRILFSQLAPNDRRPLVNPVDLKLRLVELLLADDPPRPTIIFFDEIGALGQTSLGSRLSPASFDPFLSTLRTMHSEPIDFPVLQHLTCAFAGAVDPGTLIRDPNVSPFNVGEHVPLGDLTSRQTRQLTEHLADCGLRVSEKVHLCIFAWTSGHPYQTQRLCADIESRGEGPTLELVDRIVEDVFLRPDSNDPSIDHVRRPLGNSPELEAVLRRVLAVRKVSYHEMGISELHYLGVVRCPPGSRQVVARNRIYEQAFDWLVKHSPVEELQSSVVDKRDLRLAMIDAFSLGELAAVCADVEEAARKDGRQLQVGLEMVGGKGKTEKVLELIEYLDRQGCLGYLIDVVRQQRPARFGDLTAPATG